MLRLRDVRDGSKSHASYLRLEALLKMQTSSARPASSSSGAGDDSSDRQSEVSPASFDMFDLCCGLGGGFSVVCNRLGGRVNYACDVNVLARQAYVAKNPSIHSRGGCGTSMKDMGFCRERCDIATAGLPCGPFSSANTNRPGFDDKDGEVYYHLVEAAAQRKSTGLPIPCLLIEEVFGFLDQVCEP